MPLTAARSAGTGWNGRNPETERHVGSRFSNRVNVWRLIVLPCR
jgi:hypothetical protein